ncbi:MULTISPECIES: hypothetical protein [unclassified Streptomyces]|uniref:hypothetical protein n=1 Tax=unclassified Streptomyces TaxID=2593676 RepID=UPI00081E4E69|nr:MULTISPECIES: hypothetical protein [unclassified Streptomyces]MYZ38364.1 hypothetical protein [Streptomyces sp. SID4917]SCF97991.1 hypothetical protein GA0115259_1062211 [Streptomyces sp. MnatMP-M17]
MTTAHGSDSWTAAVRRRLDLGRLLPLGGTADATWLAERAAAVELRRAAAEVPGTVLGAVRLSPADPDAAEESPVPPPPSALPPGRLRIEAEFGEEFTDMTDEPLPAVADRLRAVLFACATRRLGLRIAEIDLRVTALLERAAEPAGETAPRHTEPTEPVELRTATPKGEAALTAASVPGVACLTRTLGTAVAGTPGHVRIELATAAGHRPLEVARAVRKRVAASVPGGPSVAVVITAVNVTVDVAVDVAP